MIETFYNSYDFPKGKVDQNESYIDCAIRETFEEVGYNCNRNDICDQQSIHIHYGEKQIRMFIVHHIDESTIFQTYTRNEVKRIFWVPIYQLKYYCNYYFLSNLDRLIKCIQA